jgi:hypothetical protein
VSVTPSPVIGRIKKAITYKVGTQSLAQDTI